jgi:hypothetical protein
MKVYCCGCKTDINARLTSGGEIYPHRNDLAKLPFWKCDRCTNYVGCHRGTHKPLGVIATPELMGARRRIHQLLDPIWQSGKISRRKLYQKISDELGYSYHTAQIRSLEEARRVWAVIKRFA